MNDDSPRDPRCRALMVHPRFREGFRHFLFPHMQPTRHVTLSSTHAIAVTITQTTQIASIDDVGNVLWHSGCALAEYLCGIFSGRRSTTENENESENDSRRLLFPSPNLVDLDNLRAIELGCGVAALNGLALTLVGAVREVVCTDMEHIVPLTAVNVAANTSRKSGSGIHIEPLMWGGNAVPDWARSAPFDLCVCSDVIYETETHLPLAETLSAVLKTNGVAFLSYEVRRPECEWSFFDRALPRCGLSVLGVVPPLEMPDRYRDGGGVELRYQRVGNIRIVRIGHRVPQHAVAVVKEEEDPFWQIEMNTDPGLAVESELANVVPDRMDEEAAGCGVVNDGEESWRSVPLRAVVQTGREFAIPMGFMCTGDGDEEIRLRSMDGEGCLGDIGGEVWEAAVILSTWMTVHRHDLFPGGGGPCSVLELGSGLGFCGLVAAKLLSPEGGGSGSRVTLTDFVPHLLTNLLHNSRLNGFRPLAEEDDDGGDREEEGAGGGVCRVGVECLDWNDFLEDGPCETSSRRVASERFDMIIGSALVYAPHHDCLADVLGHFMNGERRAARTAHILQLRSRAGFSHFLRRLSRFDLSYTLSPLEPAVFEAANRVFPLHTENPEEEFVLCRVTAAGSNYCHKN